MAPVNVYDFIDNLNSSDTKRREFIRSYVKHAVECMDTDDIIQAWMEMTEDKEFAEAKNQGIDGLVEEVVYHFPDLLQDTYDVDTSLMEN
jgi:hypothetical protein